MKATYILPLLLTGVIFSCKKKEPLFFPLVNKVPEVVQGPADYRDNYLETFICMRSQDHTSGNTTTYTEWADTVMIQKDSSSNRHILINETQYFLSVNYQIGDTTFPYYQNPHGNFYWEHDTLKFIITQQYDGINQHSTNRLTGYRM
ncbi:MAG: hypothetical protein K0R65_1791 [Crocinitomicaceae bacterium]|jgi:hypothetical protein|nr:hypothetical protein [Crocinitomicaceae bacterium]